MLHSAMKRIQQFPLWSASSRWLASQFSSTVSDHKQPEPKPFSAIPGSKGLPLVGNIPLVIESFKLGEIGNMYHKLHMKYGRIFRLRLLGNTWEVNIADPEAIETVFRAEGKYPSRGIEDNMMWLYSKLQTPPPITGEVWRKTRTNASKQVVPRRVGNFVEPLCGIAEQLITHLETLQDQSGNVEDIRSGLYKWAFQGVSYFVYNENIDIYSGTDPVQQEFLKAGLDYLQSIGTIVTALPVYRLYRNKTYRDYEKALRRMQKAGRAVINRRYKEIKDSISSGTVDETKTLGLLDQWLIEGKFTEEEALSQSFDMLSAGIDTTSNTACFLLYEIARHPELQDRLVQEVTSVIGDKVHPSWEDLQKMTFVRNCVKEVMRVYNLVGGTARKVAEENVVVLGYRIPAGTNVNFNYYSMAFDSQIFEDPMEFKPDRWGKDATEKLHPFASLPFGFGPRSCYGRRLAELELYILMAKLLPKYLITTNVQEMKIEHKVLQKPAIPLHINFKSRLC